MQIHIKYLEGNLVNAVVAHLSTDTAHKRKIAKDLVKESGDRTNVKDPEVLYSQNTLV